jgi:hypothetical protein
VASASCLGQPQLRGERRFERRRKIKDALLARGTVEQGDDFSGRVKAKRVELAPAPRLLNDPRKVKNASDFAGVFEIPSSSKKLYVLADGPALNIVVGDNKIALESLGEDSFLADEYSWRRFPLVFGRNSEKKVAELAHGPDWYVNGNYAGPREFAAPPQYESFVGHYQSDSTWLRSTRIVVRNSAKLASASAAIPSVPI